MSFNNLRDYTNVFNNRNAAHRMVMEIERNENRKENPFVKPRTDEDVCWEWRRSVQANKSDTESLMHVLRWLPCDKCSNLNNNNSNNNDNKNKSGSNTPKITEKATYGQKEKQKKKRKNNCKNKKTEKTLKREKEENSLNKKSCNYVLWDMLAKNVIKFGCPRHDLYDILEKQFNYYCNSDTKENFIFCNGYSKRCMTSHPVFKNEKIEPSIKYPQAQNGAENTLYSGRWLNVNVSCLQKHSCLNCKDWDYHNNQILYQYKKWSLYDIGVKIDENFKINVQYNYLRIGTSHSSDDDILKLSIPILINRAANTPFIKKMRPGIWKYTKNLQFLGSWFGGKLFYAREKDVNLLEIIPQTFYLGIKLYSPMINNKHCTIDCLDDIVGGIGLAYTYSSESISRKTDKNKTKTKNKNKNKDYDEQKINGTGIVTNCVLLRCSSDELIETLKKCYIIAYFRKLNKNETLEIPHPNS